MTLKSPEDENYCISAICIELPSFLSSVSSLKKKYLSDIWQTYRKWKKKMSLMTLFSRQNSIIPDSSWIISSSCRSNKIIFFELTWLRVPYFDRIQFNTKSSSCKNRNMLQRRLLNGLRLRLRFCLCTESVCFLLRTRFDSQFSGTGLSRSCWFVLFFVWNSRFVCQIFHELMESVRNSYPGLSIVSW